MLFLVGLSATYHGNETGDFYWDMTWKALGPSNVAYEESGSRCGVIPDAMSESGEVSLGGTVLGNVCWEVSTVDAAELLLILEELFSFDDQRVFFELGS